MRFRPAASIGIVWILFFLNAIGQTRITPKDFLPFCAIGSDPVLNAPYSAKLRFTEYDNLPNGKVHRFESGGSEARDSQGRTYKAGERFWTYKGVLKSEVLYRIVDTVAKTYTSWESGPDSSPKVVKVIHWPENKDLSGVFGPAIQRICSVAPTTPSGETVEKLGTKVVDGVVAEGTRSSYTVSAGADGDSHPITVVDEIWYSPELKIVVLRTHDDPNSGSSRSELVDIVRGEPNVTQYRPPADYVIREMRPTSKN